MDVPVATDAGRSAAKDRKWGLIGGVCGSAVGIGAALVAVFIDGAPIYESRIYPSIFEKHGFLALDVYLLLVLLAGAGFGAAALVLAKRSPYPRTETYGAGLMSLILMSLAGILLFVRLAALIGSL